MTKHLILYRDTAVYHRVTNQAHTHCAQAALPTFINPFIMWFVPLMNIISPYTGQ